MRTLIELSTNHPIGTHFMYCIWVVRNWSDLTITERNQKLFELREQLNKARAQVAWIEQEIWLTNDRFDQQRFNDTPLFEEMFGGWQSD